MTPNQLPPLPEPDGQMTVTFGIDEKRKVPVFFGCKLTDYALAALAQQAQEVEDRVLSGVVQILQGQHDWLTKISAINLVAGLYGRAEKVLACPSAGIERPPACTYTSTQSTMCAGCGECKHTPLRIDAMGGYVCLTCIDQKLGSLLGEFGYTTPQPQPAPLAGEVADEQIDDIVERAGETVGVHHGAWDTVNPRELVRAILALRQQAVPMTPDHIWANDGIMSANGIIGFKFDAVIRIVRAVEAHHGITAKAEGGA